MTISGKWWKKLTALVVCAALAVTLAVAVSPQAEAKTYESEPASVVFFYARNNAGQDVLLKVIPIAQLSALAHGQQGSNAGKNYYFSYTDNYPTPGYCEAQGFTITELLNYVKQQTTVAGATGLAYNGGDLINLMATDSYGSYTKTWSWNQLYGEDRYYFPGMFSSSYGWVSGWEVAGEDSAKFGVDMDTYNAQYKDSDPYYANKQTVFDGGQQTTVILAPVSYAGRTLFNSADVGSSEIGIKSLIDANQGVVTGCLKDKLSGDFALRLCLPMTEADLFCGHRTAYDNFKWVYNLRLVMEQLPALTASGTVAAPQSSVSFSADKQTMYISLSCATPGASLYYSFDGSPQIPYTGTISYDVSGIDLANEPVTWYMTAVKEGWADAGIVSASYPHAAPKFTTLYTADLNSDLVFTAADEVSAEEWSAWTAALSGLAMKAAGASSYSSLAGQYTVDNTQKTITIQKEAFSATGSYAFAFSAADYATKNVSVTLRRVAPEVEMAACYYLGDQIDLSFADSLYQNGMTVRITRPGETASAQILSSYLNRTVAGKLSIKANYFTSSSCQITEPGTYTLTLSNSNYQPAAQTVPLVVKAAADKPVDAAYQFHLSSQYLGGAAGEVIPMTVTLTSDTADWLLYGGQYSLTFDSELLSLTPNSLQLDDPNWEYQLTSDQEAQTTTLTFLLLDESGEGISMTADNPLASFSLTLADNANRTIRVAALLTDKNAQAREQVTANSFTLYGHSGVLGDVNNDQLANNADLIVLARFLVNLYSLTAAQQTALDVDGQAGLNVQDAVALARYLVNLGPLGGGQ